MLRLALHSLFFLSGAAALGYQLVWAKMFSTGLGHEMPAVLAIVAAFMAGMALGAWLLDRFIPRSTSAGRWLCGLELVIGLWSVVASFTIPTVNSLALQWIGLEPTASWQWFISFIAPMITLLPATVAMGGTLPAMEKLLSKISPRDESVASVYAANTFGAVIGTLATPFLLMPALGFRKSCWALAALNLTAAVGAFAVARRSTMGESVGSRSRGKPSGAISTQRITASLFCTGLLGITYEALGVRVLSQVLEGTVFTYATVLAVFLLSTAAGAAAFHQWWRACDECRTREALLYGNGIAGMLGLFAMMFSAALYEQTRLLGDTPAAVLAAELIVSASVFTLPSFFMGALFSHFAQLARESMGGIGRVLAVNTLGAALAPVVVVLLLPSLGAKWMLFATCFAYLTLHLPNRCPRFSISIVAAFLISVAAGLSARLELATLPSHSQVVSYREGIMASVAVLSDTNAHRTLRVDNRYQMGGTAAADAEYRQAHLPLLLHSNPQRTLFLGVGTGISLGAATLYPGLEADAVELVPEVVKAMPLFESKNFGVHQNTRFRIHVADARRFVQATDHRYDVIIADLFHPYRDGAGTLYTVEHFATIRSRLATNGLFCQWLPLHQLDNETLRVITRTFQTVFPEAELWLLRFNVEVPVAALMGWNGKGVFKETNIRTRSTDSRLASELRRMALTDSLRVYGHVLADREDLARFSNGGPLNTDDNQSVTFLAPRAAYKHGAKTYESLRALASQAQLTRFAESRLANAPREFREAFTNYIAARNMYLGGLIADAEERREQALDAYVESARLSSDFTSGYAQCITYASLIARSEPAKARAILERLIAAQPNRPVARELLERLFPQ